MRVVLEFNYCWTYVDPTSSCQQRVLVVESPTAYSILRFDRLDGLVTVDLELDIFAGVRNLI